MNRVHVYDETIGDYRIELVKNTALYDDDVHLDEEHSYYLGYVTVPQGHRIFGMAPNAVYNAYPNLTVELTYAVGGRFGFDTAHYGEDRSENYAKNQLNHLLSTLKE